MGLKVCLAKRTTDAFHISVNDIGYFTFVEYIAALCGEFLVRAGQVWIPEDLSFSRRLPIN